MTPHKQSFSDDNLARLKAKLLSVHHGDPFHIDRDYCEALLARLEASERCLTPGTDYCCICFCEDCESNRKAWRKAVGK